MDIWAEIPACWLLEQLEESFLVKTKHDFILIKQKKEK